MLHISTSACFLIGRAVEQNLEVKRAEARVVFGWVTFREAYLVLNMLIKQKLGGKKIWDFFFEIKN